MESSKQNDANELTYKTEIVLHTYKTNLWLPKGELTGGGTNWETGIDIYTH